MNKVYVLSHIHLFEDGHEDYKLIGVFDEESTAVKYLEKAKALNGFKNCLEGFCIDKYRVDKINLHKLTQIKKNNEKQG